VSGEVERIWKEATVAYLKILFYNCPGGTEKETRKSSVRTVSPIFSTFNPILTKEVFSPSWKVPEFFPFTCFVTYSTYAVSAHGIVV
jgi:hypothetical protein